MDYPLFVGGGQAIGQLRPETQDIFLGQSAGGKFLMESLTGYVLGGHEIPALIAVEIVDSLAVGTVQFGKSKGFFAEMLARGFVGEYPRGQDLDGDFAVEALVVGAVNLSHSALPDFLSD